MAELLIARGFQPPDSLAMRLRDELPDDLWVVVGPQVHGYVLEAVVVAPQSLTILHRDDEHDALDPAGRTAAFAGARQALAAFLADEFPALRLPIQQLRVTMVGTGQSLGGDDPPVVSVDDLATTLVHTPVVAGVHMAARQQADVGYALMERRLTRTQRAQTPFVLRSAARLVGGNQVWTLKELARRLDQMPEDGVAHLRDGSLARWLDEQGAVHLGRLARQVVRESSGDPRVALEEFLLGSGLVDRPTAHVQPQRLDLGTVIAGQAAIGKLSIHQARGRGYLYGDLHSRSPWLRLEPDHFTGARSDVRVFVETAGLSIQTAPHAATVVLTGSPWTDSMAVPVTVKVVPEPSSFVRHWLRPALMALIGGAIGLLPGSAAAMIIADERVAALPAVDVVLWAMVSLWALAGAVIAHRRRQMPTLGAIARATLRSLLPALGVLFVLGMLGGWLLARAPLWTGLSVAGLAILFPVFSGGAVAPHVPRPRTQPPRRTWAGTLEVSIILIIIAAVASYWWRPAPLTEPVVIAELWLGDRLTELEQGVDGLIARWLLFRYDRRAPAATPMPTMEQAGAVDNEHAMEGDLSNEVTDEP